LLLALSGYFDRGYEGLLCRPPAHGSRAWYARITLVKSTPLVEEIARERLDHSAESRASAAMRREMTFLLPKLAARRNEPHAPERGANAL
jgi:hypothetical protein